MTGSKSLTLSEIRIDGGTQPRAELSEALVSEYAEAMEAGAEFPPVVVFNDGSAEWLADGFHRYHAARKSGVDSLVADSRSGTRRDAVLYSVGANTEHGLRRTNEDKRRSVMKLLNDEEWVQWSDREIARRCAVSNPFVGSQRSSLLTVNSEDQTRTVRTKHGTTTEMDVTKIGKTARLVLDTVNELGVEASNKDVAEAAGVSTSTVSKWRSRHGVSSGRTEQINVAALERVSTFISGNLSGVQQAIAILQEKRRFLPSLIDSALAVAPEEDVRHWIDVLGTLIGAARKLQAKLKET